MSVEIETQSKEEHKVVKQRRARKLEMQALWDKVDDAHAEIRKVKKEKTALKREINKLKKKE